MAMKRENPAEGQEPETTRGFFSYYTWCIVAQVRKKEIALRQLQALCEHNRGQRRIFCKCK